MVLQCKIKIVYGLLMISILRLPCTKTSHFNHRFPYGYLVTTSYQLQHLQ
jgi:hypothetical protein